MKKTPKKLVLSRETVRSLDLGSVVGGLTYASCPSNEPCPNCGTANCHYTTIKDC